MSAAALSNAIAPEGATKRLFRPDVQGLRAIAVLAVIFDHLLHWPTTGFVGVDIFFVLSGYLITGLLLREYERTGTISFKGFYIRRFKRIIPASFLVIVCTVIASYFLTPGDRFLRTISDGIWAVLFSANWNFAAQNTDYFQQSELPSPLQHYWSLGVEEQFYFVWPWLMLAILLIGSKFLRWERAQERIAAGVTIGLISAGSLAYSLYVTAVNPNLAYFTSLGRAWELGMGALVAIFGGAIATRIGRAQPIVSWIGTLGVVGSLFLTNSLGAFPAPGALFAVLATALVVVAGEQQQRFLVPLTNPVARYIGDISYSLYLWHFPMIVLLLALFAPGLSYQIVALVLTALIAVASYHLVENPIRRSRWLTTRRKVDRSVVPSRRAAFVVIAVLVVADAILLPAAIIRTSEVPAAAAIPAAAITDPASSTDKSVSCLGAADVVEQSCSGVNLGSVVAPAVSDLSSDMARQTECWMPQGAKFNSCHYATNAANPIRVAVVGDSHAGHLIPGILAQQQKLNWDLTTIIGDGCSLSTAPAPRCAAESQVVNAVTTGRRYDLVITTADRLKSTTAASASEYSDVFRRVIAHGAKLVVIGDVPEVAESALLCVARVGFEVAHNSCDTSRTEALRRTDALRAAASMTEGAKFVDLTDIFCTAKECPEVIGNVLVYRDTGAHLTTTFSDTLGPVLVSRIEKAAGLT